MNNESSKTIEGLNANRLSHGINDNIFLHIDPNETRVTVNAEIPLAS